MAEKKIYKIRSKTPDYEVVEVEFNHSKISGVRLKSVKENGREIVHLLSKKTEENIIADCKKSIKQKNGQTGNDNTD